MPIELRCSQCDTLLRVPDGSEGRETRCPSCQTMLAVPGTSASQYPDSRYPDSRYPDSRYPDSRYGQSGEGYSAGSRGQEANPFSSPATSPEAFRSGSAPPPAAGPIQLDLGDLLTQGWEIFSRHMLPCLGGWLILSAITIFTLLIGIAVTALLMAIASGGFNDEEVAIIVGIVVGPIALAAWGILCCWLTLGLMRFTLRIVRDGTADIGLVFSGGRGTMTLFIAAVLSTLAITFGYAFCIVPGVILTLMFSQYYWLIADRRMGVFDSLGTSIRVTDGHKWNLFLLYLLQVVVGMAVGFIPYIGPFINLLLVQPFFLIVFAVLYLKLTGQPTVRYRAGPTSGVAPAMPPQPAAGADLGATAPHPEFGD